MKRIVICLDGTSNEPEKGKTNVARLFDMLVASDTQLVYYDSSHSMLLLPRT